MNRDMMVNQALVLVFTSFLASCGTVNAQGPVTRPMISFCGGNTFTCAVFDSKQAKCWGLKRALGQSTSGTDSLGDATSEIGQFLPFLNFGTGAKVDKIFCGDQHLCSKLDTGDVKCQGDNTDGQTGQGTTTNPIGSVTSYDGDTLPVVNVGSSLQVLDMALGAKHSCAVVTGNKVKCFGYNINGQLGYEDTTTRGTSSGQMGSNLAFVDLGTNVEVASIHTGPFSDHTCVIVSAPVSDAGKFKCWGYNNNGQLGYGDTTTRGSSSGQMGTNLGYVDLGVVSTVSQLGVTSKATCALTTYGYMKCFGYGGNGELASGSLFDIRVTSDDLPKVVIDTGKIIVKLIAGDSHVCLLYDDYLTVKCWGRNGGGELGQSDYNDRGIDSGSTIPNIPAIQLGTGSLNITSIYAGGHHTCVVFFDNSVKCFGQNGFGQLAIGSNVDKGGGQFDMGTFLSFSTLLAPTPFPTNAPTSPTPAPTTKSPTTRRPTPAPTRVPTNSPVPPTTESPTQYPTTASPSKSPTKKPTQSPTPPTKSPSQAPSGSPTKKPTQVPTRRPTRAPTPPTTLSPTKKPGFNSANHMVAFNMINLAAFVMMSIIYHSIF